MKARSIFAMVCLAAACGGKQPTAATPEAPVRGRASGAQRAPGPLLGEYAATWDERSGILHVAGRFEAGAGASFLVERGVERFVRNVASSADAENAAFAAGSAEGRRFTFAACAKTPCRIRYDVALREAARAIEDLDVASDEGSFVEAPPSTWLLSPESADGRARVRFRVKTAEGTRFVTGVFRSKQADDAWDISLDDLWSAPYSAFGPLRVRIVEEGGGLLQLAIAPGRLARSDDELADWTKSSARAVSTYFAKFPMPEALVIVAPARGRWVGGGRTLSGGGGTVFMRLGEQASMQALREDWVLVHELTHLAFPSVAREHDWAEEGLATYVEPFARVRAGTMRADEAWDALTEGLPNGLPRPGDQGLDRTPTWGRRYWGGALFYFLADIELRKRSNNGVGLDHALRGLLAAGGTNATRWSLDDAYRAADRATGFTVLFDLHAAMGTSPHPVDLDATLRSLGVGRARGRIVFDDAAPLAAVRRGITYGTVTGR